MNSISKKPFETQFASILSTSGILNLIQYHESFNSGMKDLTARIQQNIENKNNVNPQEISRILKQIINLHTLRKIYDNVLVGLTGGTGWSATAELYQKMIPRLVNNKQLMKQFGTELRSLIEQVPNIPKVFPSFDNEELDLQSNTIRNIIANSDIIKPKVTQK